MTIEEIKEWRRTAWMQGTTSVMIDTLLEDVERLEKHNASSDQVVVELDQQLTIATDALEKIITNCGTGSEGAFIARTALERIKE